MDAWQRHLWWERHGQWLTVLFLVIGAALLVYSLVTRLVDAF